MPQVKFPKLAKVLLIPVRHINALSHHVAWTQQLFLHWIGPFIPMEPSQQDIATMINLPPMLKL